MLGALLGRARQEAADAVAAGAPARPQVDMQRFEPVKGAATAGRRDRRPEGGEDALTDAVAQKLLHAWLQNRHQTLFPLSLNFRLLSAGQRGAVVRTLAAVLLAGRPAGAAEDAAPGMADWLRGVGADAATEALFREALQSPPPLHAALEGALAENVAVYAYVAALAAADPRHPASLRLLDVLEARFELPTAMVRSAVRRYRR